jgi:hypothetical protein
MTVVLSPELALIDPELRLRALRELPPIEPFDFLRARSPAVEPLVLNVRARARLRADEVPEPPPLVLAAAAYTFMAIARVTVMAAFFVIGLMTSVALLQIIA